MFRPFTGCPVAAASMPRASTPAETTRGVSNPILNRSGDDSFLHASRMSAAPGPSHAFTMTSPLTLTL